MGGANQAITGLCAPGVIRTAASPNCGAPTGSVQVWSLMGNVLYDFAPDAAISPFVGAGLGVNQIKVDYCFLQEKIQVLKQNCKHTSQQQRQQQLKVQLQQLMNS